MILDFFRPTDVAQAPRLYCVAAQLFFYKFIQQKGVLVMNLCRIATPIFIGTAI